jgi:hypothetical protein
MKLILIKIFQKFLDNNFLYLLIYFKQNIITQKSQIYILLYLILNLVE